MDSLSDITKTYHYTSVGQLKNERRIQGNDSLYTTYSYDASGNRTQMAEYNYETNTKDITDYTYDANNRMTQAATMGGLSFSGKTGDLTGMTRYYYDNNGNTLAEQNKTYTTTGNESSDMTLSGRSGGNEFKLYQYDDFNRLIQYNDGATEAKYTYNTSNLRASKTVNGTKTNYVWNGQNLASETKNDVTTVYTYDITGVITSKTDNDTVMRYVKDPHGNVIATSKNDSILGEYDYDTNTKTITDYTYDTNNRMTQSAVTTGVPFSGTASGDVTGMTRYYYDNNGNTLAEQNKTYTTTGNESSDMTLSGRSGGNKLKLYGYDDFNRLIQYNDGATEAKYTYSANNLRASKTVNGTKTNYVWSGNNLASETKNDVTTVYTYDITGVITSKTDNDTVMRYVKDPHGNVIATSKNDSILGEYDYTAFGIQIKNTDASNPFRYCGEYYDEELDSVYLRNRYYNPSTGRFLTEDPIKDGLNWYCYCSNNPIAFIDPQGLVITCDKSNYEQIKSLLGQIAGNSLEFAYNEEKGEIEITKTYDTKHHVGQTLVSNLINLPNVVNVNVGVADENENTNSKWPASADTNGVIQIYIDPDDVLGNGTLYTYVEDSNGKTIEEAFPQFIIFGHELIHAWREIMGLFDYNVEQGQIPYDVGLIWPAEEIKTMGINYMDTAGVWMQNYSTYSGRISENGLRLENGLNTRVSYKGWWQ